MLQSIAVFAIALSLPLFQNCSGVGFNHSDDSSGNTVTGVPTPQPTPNCTTTQLQTITTPIKILLVIDTSLSNVGDATHYGTDPMKSVRAGSIQAFYNDFASKTNFNWGMITFSGNTATAILNNGGNGQSPAFTGSASVMQQAINYFRGLQDSGTTPYRAAIAMARNAISNDGADTAQTKYIVVFLSDGLPTDYDTNGGAINDTQINADVTALMNLKSGRITFNTVYYGPASAEASNRLHMMANTGQGHFLDTNANPAAKDFVINNVVTIPGSACTY